MEAPAPAPAKPKAKPKAKAPTEAAASASTATTTKKKLIVLCDGTWCGSETNTEGNIFLLAKMIGIDMAPHAKRNEFESRERGVKACYFPGSGLGGTFLEYLFNGATGSDIGEDCIEVYSYIVQHFSEDHEIWMFGLSRGSYTVRCVAGMINNCGIIRKTTTSDGQLDDRTIRLCNEVYKIYRSSEPEDHPKAKTILRFKEQVSYNVPTPVKFMGLLDTVGSRGIPKLDAGIGLTYPEFRDQKVSKAVEKVYHALAIHDRLWGFGPCRALREADPNKPKLEIHERWFPGCHYDLGRQRFRFLRNGQNWLERAAGVVLSPLLNVIEPNHVLADFVLQWMLESIRKEDPEGIVIQGINDEIEKLTASMLAPTPKIGSGDIYSHIIDYGPLGTVWKGLGTPIMLAQTRDRRISDTKADLAFYNHPSPQLAGSTIQELAKIDSKRYPSQTYDNFILYLESMGLGVHTTEPAPED
ncbi:hypothetical protein BGZ96_012223 [Linnemannia gamsii]|uniref:T6SS Phospholipase effector Tle1-like catalytic domain-containing protein n=1 Tax=Linnemannia gamsii TaxID=64522 RepID=A0ABQ7JSE0_9FUNG|nr:hypothetical protein BGZ96_012223 [Linnemannia gamsii]